MALGQWSLQRNVNMAYRSIKNVTHPLNRHGDALLTDCLTFSPYRTGLHSLVTYSTLTQTLKYIYIYIYIYMNFL